MTDRQIQPLELYLHIPFCVKKCLYCDFLSGSADASLREAYLEALLTELGGRASQYREYTVTSVFVGGGTPSVLTGEQMVRLLGAVRTGFRLAEGAEISAEANPGTMDTQKLAAWRRAGINRLSIGLQSAETAELAAIGRIHSWEQFAATYALAREAGFSNVNVDIMSALPGQSRESYQRTLEKVLGLNPPPEHISAYSLIVEEGTPFYEMQQRGELELPDEETDRDLYHMTKSILHQRGYERYEISNYAQPGYECRHNCGYWRRTDYVGFGVGAASLFQAVRFRNGEALQPYIEHPLDCRMEFQTLSREEQMEEFMFLGLRLTAGVEEKEFLRQFGVGLTELYGEVIERNRADGLLDWDGGRLFLTEEGLDVSNYVMAQFLLS